MDQGLPNQRRRARAIAIRVSIDDRRKALTSKALMAAASVAALIEATWTIHGLIGAHR